MPSIISFRFAAMEAALRKEWADIWEQIATCREGIDEGRDESGWTDLLDAAEEHRDALKRIGMAGDITLLPPRPSDDEIAAGARFGILYDPEGDWPWYVVDQPNEEDDHSSNAVQRNGEWRVYYETLIEAGNELGIDLDDDEDDDRPCPMTGSEGLPNFCPECGRARNTGCGREEGPADA